MSLVPADWSQRHIEMGRKLRNPQSFEPARESLLELHAQLHRREVSGGDGGNAIDAFFTPLAASSFAAMPGARGTSIAWCLWHISRIEDLTMNLLVARGSQVFDSAWQSRLNAAVTDTGNAMTQEEIRTFSVAVRPAELLAYRDQVGKKSRAIVTSLTAADMKRKVLPADLERLYREGGLAEHPDSLWLLDFWGKKDVAGLFLMPLTRHQTMHLRDCEKYAAVLAKQAQKPRPELHHD